MKWIGRANSTRLTAGRYFGLPRFRAGTRDGSAVENPLHQSIKRHAQGPGKADHIQQGDVPLAAFDAPGIVAMNAGHLRQPFLRIAPRHPKLADGIAESDSRIIVSSKWHDPKLSDPIAWSTHYECLYHQCCSSAAGRMLFLNSHMERNPRARRRDASLNIFLSDAYARASRNAP
jgi:hypothetical protein